MSRRSGSTRSRFRCGWEMGKVSQEGEGPVGAGAGAEAFSSTRTQSLQGQGLVLFNLCMGMFLILPGLESRDRGTFGCLQCKPGQAPPLPTDLNNPGIRSAQAQPISPTVIYTPTSPFWQGWFGVRSRDFSVVPTFDAAGGDDSDSEGRSRSPASTRIAHT